MSLSAKRAQAILAKFPRQRILVVGDLMLDRYIYGTVSRISPEAPVPVVQVARETQMPGGASNVAWNVRSLGARAAVAGLLGRDHAGHELRSLLERGGVGLAGTLESHHLKSIVKMRVVAERQQVVRVDFNDRPTITPAMRQAFCRRVAAEVRQADGVILEDYGKGLLEQDVVDAVFHQARKKSIPVGLDPKDDHELRVAGISVATPNRKEAFAIAGLRDPGAGLDPLRDGVLLEVGRRLLDKWAPQFLMITLGAQGMLLMAPGEPPRHIPTRAREVFDVSGAGDTVIATCVTALAAGANSVEASELANYAAGVVVGKLGTATCAPDELIRHIRGAGV